jgi:parallel beta-helix repeat protein
VDRRILVRIIQATIIVWLLALVPQMENPPLKAASDSVTLIRTDGSIEPATAPLKREGDVYTLTASMESRLEILKDDIVIEGDGHTLHGNSSGIGVVLVGVSNVTVQHLNIRGHEFGVSIEGDFNTIQENNITDNVWFGVGHCASSVNNTVTNNYIRGGKLGVWFCTSFNNSVLENSILNCSDRGIWIEYSSHNLFYGNLITRNAVGVALLRSSHNKFHGNSFVNNTRHIKLETQDSNNMWDNKFPQGGNYWDDHPEAKDLFRGPFQNKTGSDGIVDIPYTVNENNSDRYPLIKEVRGQHDVGIQELTSIRTIIPHGKMTVLEMNVVNYGQHQEDFNVTVEINSIVMSEVSLTLQERESSQITYVWNTTDFSKGNYMVMIHTSFIQHESDISDNLLIDETFVITKIGDVDGDFDVDSFDIVAVAGAYGSIGYDQQNIGNYDLIENEKIDIFDIVFAISEWQKQT